MKVEMTLEKARELVSTIVAERIRWGKNYGTGPYALEDLLDALVLLARADNERITGQDEELTKANRQTAAAKAQAAKHLKRAHEAEARVQELEAALGETKENTA